MLLVTKAVGDLLGVRGIAEEAIRFNGYPFLEKNDHVYDAPGWYLLMLMLGQATRLAECPQYQGSCEETYILYEPQA